MELVTLGTGSAIPTSERMLPSAALLRNGEIFLFDCGEGTQMQMMKARLKLSKINHIFISHLHGDHIYGLMGLIATMHLLDRQSPLHLCGPQGLKQYTELAMKVAEMDADFAIDVQELAQEFQGGSVLETTEYAVTAFPLEHRVFTLGYRFQERDKPGHLDMDLAQKLKIPEGPMLGTLKMGGSVTLSDGRVIHAREVVGPPIPGDSLAYCTDTSFTPNAVELARNATALLHDATFTTEHSDKAKETGHSTSLDAARVALEANVGQLVVTHISARQKEVDTLLKECKSVFPNTVVASDLMRISIGKST
jgi:ribonuclease Z